jgi:YihY family inner membrane protein
VIKKHGEDRGGQLAALLTYYGFLSLFPLLLVCSAILQIISFNNSELRQSVINHATQYFPVMGQHLESQLNDLSGTKAILVISIFFTLWGAKGIADIFQYALNHIWGVPHPDRPGFVKRTLKSLGIIFLAGGGFIAAAFLSSLATTYNHDLTFRTLSILVSVSVLFGVFLALFKWGLAGPKAYKNKAVMYSALSAAIGIQFLQTVGVLLVSRQLKHLNSFYGSFGATLALLFWIYLQAQVVVYAAEIGSVFDKHKWPRDL